MESCEMGSLIFLQGKLEKTIIKSKISKHIRHRMLSHPKLTYRGLLDPGGKNRCTRQEYLDFQKAFDKVCAASSHGIKGKVLMWYNGHLNEMKKYRNKNLPVSRE